MGSGQHLAEQVFRSVLRRPWGAIRPAPIGGSNSLGLAVKNRGVEGNDSNNQSQFTTLNVRMVLFAIDTKPSAVLTVTSACFRMSLDARKRVPPNVWLQI